MSARDKPLPALALVEPQQLVRSTVAGAVRQLALARVVEFARIAGAIEHLDAVAVDGLVIHLDEQGDALALLKRLRAGGLRSAADIPVAVTADAVDAGRASLLRQLAVRRVLLKPFKVKAAIETIAGLWTPVPQPELAEPIDLG